MDDDFNTALAIAHMNDNLRSMNGFLPSLCKHKNSNKWKIFKDQLKLFWKAANTLGLFREEPGEYLKQEKEKKVGKLNLDVVKIESLIADRNLARAEKDWRKADACRDELTAMGVLLEDGPEGTSWKAQ